MQHSLSKMLFEDKDPAKDLVIDITKARHVLKENYGYSSDEIDYLIESGRIDEIAPLLSILAKGGAAAGRAAGAAVTTGTRVAASAGKATARAVTTGTKIAAQATVKAAKEVGKQAGKALVKKGKEMATDVALNVADKISSKDEDEEELTGESIDEALKIFSLKKANFLNEENVSSQGTEEENSESGKPNQDDESGKEEEVPDKEEEDEKKKLGDKLDISDLIGEESISHQVIQKIATRVLQNIKNQGNIKNMQKEFSSYDIENLDKEQSEKLKVYLEKLKEDHPEGMIDRTNLKSFLTKPQNLPGIGKTIINPAQMKAGSDQKLAVDPADIKFYQDNKIIPFMLSYQDKKGRAQTLSGHKGDKDYVVVFIAPAFGAVMEDDKEVNLFKTLYPEFSNEVKLDKGHVIIDCNELPFIYVEPEKELDALQTTFSTAIKGLLGKVESRKSDGKPHEEEDNQDESSSEEKPEADESVFESFVYTGGISQLLNEENRSIDVLKFINIAAPDKTSDKDDEESQKIERDFIINKSLNVIKSAYTSYLEIQKDIFEEEKSEESQKKADAIGSAIGSVSSFYMGGMKGMMAYGALGSLPGIGLASAGAVGGLAISMMPLMLGVTVALPALEKSAKLGLRAYTGFSNYKRKLDLNTKTLDEQIEVVLKDQTKNSGFKSINDESTKLVKVILSIKERLEKEQKDPEQGVMSESDDYYKITTKDFLKLCSKKMLAFTEISDIASDEKKQKVFRNFLIGSNKILSLVQVEIDEVAGMEIEDKLGQKDILQKDIDFDNKDVLKEVIEELKTQIQDIDAKSVHEKAIKASILAALKMGNLEQATSLIKELKEEPSKWMNRTSKYLEENKDSSEDEAMAAASEMMGVPEDLVKNEMTNMSMRKISESQIEALVSFQKLLLEALGIKPKESEISKSIKNNENILVYKSKKELKEEDKERADVSGDDLIELIAIPSLKDLDSDSFKQMMKSYGVKDIAGFNKSLLEIVKQVLFSLIYEQKVTEVYKFIESITSFKEAETKHAVELVKNIKPTVQKLSQDVTTESKSIYYKNSLSSLLFETSYSELNFNN